jgi:hypothetical protein
MKFLDVCALVTKRPKTQVCPDAMEAHLHIYALVCPGNGVGVDSDQRPAHMLRHVAYAVGPSFTEYFPATQAE